MYSIQFSQEFCIELDCFLQQGSYLDECRYAPSHSLCADYEMPYFMRLQRIGMKRESYISFSVVSSSSISHSRLLLQLPFTPSKRIRIMKDPQFAMHTHPSPKIKWSMAKMPISFIIMSRDKKDTSLNLRLYQGKSLRSTYTRTHSRPYGRM